MGGLAASGQQGFLVELEVLGVPLAFTQQVAQQVTAVRLCERSAAIHLAATRPCQSFRAELLRPKPGDVLNADDLYGVFFHAVGHHVVFMHNQFTRAGNAARSAQRRECKQQGGLILDFPNERAGSHGVVLCNVGGNLI